MRLLVTTAIALVAIGASSAATGITGAECTEHERDRRADALAAFERATPALRGAYFRAHPKERDRKAWNKRRHAARTRLARALDSCEAAIPLGAEPRPLTFWPQAGILGQDLWLANFVDLDPGPGLRDPFCGTRTYDTHTGEDVTIRSFREQDIGVPIFAADDGVVVEVQKLAADYSYGQNTFPNDNHVVLRHAGGRETVYGHLKRVSIGVRVGNRVRAGEQIAETASSGNSSWPHLHFTVRDAAGTPLEPWSGPCRPGESGWVAQPDVATTPYVRAVTLGDQPFEGRAALPFDEGPRTGTFRVGTRAIYARVEIVNASGLAPTTWRVLRPDGSIALDVSGSGAGWRLSEDERRLEVSLLVTGRWRVVYSAGDQVLADAPFDVVASGAARPNRAPYGVAVQLSPTAPATRDVVVCTVRGPLAVRDPDYDIVRYRYRWVASGRLLRQVTSAGMTDVLTRGAARAGERLSCSVTPSDGRTTAPTATFSTPVMSS